jgi:Tol biopolymer transport system component
VNPAATARTLGVLTLATALSSGALERGSFVTVPQRDSGGRPLASADVSANGHSVAFVSYDRLVPADVDNRADVYVLDLDTRRVTLESAAADAAADNDRPRLSGDGRYLVFESVVSDSLTARARGAIVFCDRSSGTSTVLTARPGREPANGSSREPEISDDGTVVVFTSAATNLVSGGDPNDSMDDVYAIELPDGVIRRIAVNDGAGRLVAASSPTVSGDGRVVAFVARQSSVGGGTSARPEPAQVYAYDGVDGTTARVSVARGGGLPDGDSWGPAISSDGRFIAFVSAATNLVSGDGNRLADVFLQQRGSGSAMLVSAAADGDNANGASASPSISADGGIVAFQSDASNLVCARRCPPSHQDINLLWDVFVFTRHTSTIVQVSADTNARWIEASRQPAIDASGRVVAFSSRHPVDAQDRGNDFDLFVMAPLAMSRLR